ncbi:MAG: glycosyl hydrolase family 28-related protein, partial [Flavobacterium sp.]
MKLFKTNTILKNTINKIANTSTLILLVSCSLFAQQKEESKKQWKKMESIIKSVKYPTFKNKIYNILEYGAQSNSTFDNTKAIAKTIQECSKNGGGIVLVPKGTFLSGPIHLENNVNFHLEKDAEIIFSTNPKHYYPLV